MPNPDIPINGPADIILAVLAITIIGEITAGIAATVEPANNANATTALFFGFFLSSIV
jgi:hypothetical protein